MLFLDGTFLKDKYKGTLLVAIGKNGNQGMHMSLKFFYFNNLHNNNSSYST
jgi:hypothetical protein